MPNSMMTNSISCFRTGDQTHCAPRLLLCHFFVVFFVVVFAADFFATAFFAAGFFSEPRNADQRCSGLVGFWAFFTAGFATLLTIQPKLSLPTAWRAGFGAGV